MLDCEPVFDYGRRTAKWEYTGAGYHQATRHAPRASTANCALTTDMRMGFEGRRATARTLLKEGDTAFFALSWSEHDPPTTYEEAYARLDLDRPPLAALAGPRRVPRPSVAPLPRAQRADPEGPDASPRPARCVAAPTTSLPETPGGERNWDYRYTWIRDSTFALWALYTLGFDWEANDFFYFVADVAERERRTLQIMYGVDGERELDRVHARPPRRLRERAPGADRQRRL